MQLFLAKLPGKQSNMLARFFWMLSGPFDMRNEEKLYKKGVILSLSRE